MGFLIKYKLFSINYCILNKYSYICRNKNTMKENEQIKLIVNYLQDEQVYRSDYDKITFDYDLANYRSMNMSIGYEDGIFDIFTAEGDYLCELTIDEMIYLFPQVDELVNCKTCDGLGWYDNDPSDMDRIECKHENLMYR